MTVWCCITPERAFKTKMILEALEAGIPHAKVIYGKPPNDGAPFIVWGQSWLALTIIPDAVRAHRPFWHIDNGFWRPARGTAHGYYRLTYRSLSPILLDQPSGERHKLVQVRNWKTNGTNVLIAHPGQDFGRALGIDCRAWINSIEGKVRAITNRPIIIRPKGSSVALSTHLSDAWCLVTHSSNVAVDAVLAGVPVFVEPTNPASPVGRTDLAIESPIYPDRTHWLQSLMSQQFTLTEMRVGVAWKWMQRIAAQVDGNG